MSTYSPSKPQSDSQEQPPWYRPPITAGAVPLRSATVGGVVAVVAISVSGLVLGAFSVGALGIVMGVITAVSIAAVGVNRPLYALAGGVGLLIGIGASIGVPAFYVVTGTSADAGLAFAGVLVGFGVARFRIDAVGDGAVSRAIGWLLRVAAVITTGAAAVAVIQVDLATLVSRLGPAASLVTPADESSAIVGFVVLAWVALGGLWSVVIGLPPAEILPPAKRDRYRRLRKRTVSVAVAVIGFGSIALALAAAASQQIGGGSDALWAVVTSSLMRVTLLRVAVAGVVVATAIQLARSAGVALLIHRPEWLSSVLVVGGAITIAGGVAADFLLGAIETVGVMPPGALPVVLSVTGAATIGVVGAAGAVLAIALAVAVLPVLSSVGLLPTETAGPRVACAGLIVASIVCATAGSTTVTIAVVIAALVVWDVTEYGLGLTADLGDRPSRLDGELVHAGGSVGVGLVGLAALTGIQQLLPSVEIAGDGALVAVTFATATVVLVFVIVRG